MAVYWLTQPVLHSGTDLGIVCEQIVDEGIANDPVTDNASNRSSGGGFVQGVRDLLIGSPARIPVAGRVTAT